MVAEKRMEGDIQVTQSGIPSCCGQDVQYSGEVLSRCAVFKGDFSTRKLKVIGNLGIMLV